MNKTSLATFVVAGILLASCAKEKDGYDKNLTADTWNYTYGKYDYKTVTEKKFTDGTLNSTKTATTTTTVENGKKVEIINTLEQTVGQADYFLKYTTTWDYTADYKFEKDGSFTSNESEGLRSILTEETNEQPVTTTHSNAPTVISGGGKWFWQNNGEQKAAISVNGLGTFDVVSIKKDEMILELTYPQSVKTEHPSPTLTVVTTGDAKTEIRFTR